MSVETLIFPGSDFEYLVGCDIPPERARELIAGGRAAPGPKLEAPAAVYLQRDLSIRGHVYPAGHMLHVGGEITEGEALCLMRGSIGVHALLQGVEQQQTPLVSLPGGGIG